jgi:hypothetical protein
MRDGGNGPLATRETTNALQGGSKADGSYIFAVANSRSFPFDGAQGQDDKFKLMTNSD